MPQIAHVEKNVLLPRGKPTAAELCYQYPDSDTMIPSSTSSLVLNSVLSLYLPLLTAQTTETTLDLEYFPVLPPDCETVSSSERETERERERDV